MLLLAPLLAEADSAPCHDPWPPGSVGAQGSSHGLCSHFRWMANHVPAFRVPGARVHILTSPDQFYQAMKVCGAVWNEEGDKFLVCVCGDGWKMWQMMDVFPAAAASSELAAAAASPPDTSLHVVHSIQTVNLPFKSALMCRNSVSPAWFLIKGRSCFWDLKKKKNYHL